MKSFNKTCYSNIRTSFRYKLSDPKKRKSLIQQKGEEQRQRKNIFKSNTKCLSNHTQTSTYKAAIVYDNDPRKGKIVYENNIDEKRQIASLTKIMTCLIVLLHIQQNQIKPQRQFFIVSKEAASLKGTTASLEEGDKISIWDLLYGLMLPSGNDAAFCLAECIGKGITKNNEVKKLGYRQIKNKWVNSFVNQMNRRAELLKMKNTNYSNPHGLAEQNNYSTASDQLILIRKCLQNSYFRKIVSAKLYFSMVEQSSEQSWTREMLWENTNRLLYKGYSGIKTGNTGPAGYCLASWFHNESADLIIIVLGTSSKEERDNETIKLTKLCVHQFSKPTLQKKQ